ncbi:MAG: trigger factor [Deltaproteobacteria bacterium]|nr:trigger factor [Deltaproteobacteria bacterium]
MTDIGKSFDIESVSSIEKSIKGKIPWITVKEKFDETYREISKTVSIKGFRRGKVPRSMLEKMFKKHVEKDIVQELVRSDLVEILQTSEGIRPVGDVTEWDIQHGEIEKNSDFAYTANFEVVPEVEIKDYKGHEAVKYIVAVKDEQIDHELEHLRNHYKKSLPVEDGNVETGHIISFSVMGKVGEKPVSIDSVKVPVPDGENISGLKEKIAAGFAGKEISSIPEENDIEIEFDENDAEYPGEKGSFLVEFEGVSRIEVPELDDDFAKETGKSDTIDELKETIRKDLEKQFEEKSTMLLEKAIMKSIIEKNDFQVGEKLIKKQAEMKVNQTLMGLGLGVNDNNLMGDVKNNLISSYAAKAEIELKENLSLESISKIENVEVSDQEIEDKIIEIANEEGKNPERVKADYLKDNGMDTLKYYIKMSKTLDFLKTESKITEEEVDEFPELDKPEVPEEPAEEEPESEE